jgi:hypothetical protein
MSRGFVALLSNFKLYAHAYPPPEGIIQGEKLKTRQRTEGENIKKPTEEMGKSKLKSHSAANLAAASEHFRKWHEEYTERALPPKKTTL